MDDIYIVLIIVFNSINFIDSQHKVVKIVYLFEYIVYGNEKVSFKVLETEW